MLNNFAIVINVFDRFANPINNTILEEGEILWNYIKIFII